MGKKTITCGAAALSAFLLWAAFPPANETWDALFALAPMLIVTRRLAPRAAAGWWFTSAFGFWFATLSWMPAICKNNGPWPLVVLGWIGLSAVMAAYAALFGYLAAGAWRRADGQEGALRRRVFTRLFLLVVAEPVLWAGLEWLRGTLFTGFAWNFLGTALGRFPAFATPARWGGVYLASALVLLVNGTLATLLLRILDPLFRRTPDACPPKVRRLVRFLETAVPLGVVAGVLACTRPEPPSAALPRENLRVALIQRNAPCVFSSREAEDPYKAYFALLDTAQLARPDLAILAESAFCEFGPAQSDRTRQAALHFANRLGGATVIGGADDVVWSNGVRRVYNAAACYTPAASNALAGIYRKQHLVPFGEYIPFDKWIVALQKLSPIGVSLHAGAPAYFDVNGLKLAPLICFEDTVSSLSRKAAQDGASALVFITNDSWFSHSHEAAQHAAQAVMRAVETGLPVLRVGNSGVTGVISGTGKTRYLSDGKGRPLVDQAGCQVESLGIVRKPPLTPYVRFGDTPLLILFGLVLAALFRLRR